MHTFKNTYCNANSDVKKLLTIALTNYKVKIISLKYDIISRGFLLIYLFQTPTNLIIFRTLCLVLRRM